MTKWAENAHDYHLLRLPLKPLPPAHHAREFRWQHLTVIAALAFVLGVVVYNLATP